jgi:hypothetical protein
VPAHGGAPDPEIVKAQIRPLRRITEQTLRVKIAGPNDPKRLIIERAAEMSEANRMFTKLLIMLAAIAALLAACCSGFATEPFRYSAMLRGGKKVGDLTPGISTLNDVIKMFPAAARDYPGNPRPPVSYPEVKIGKFEPQPTTVYNPPESSYALFFDENQKLVIIEDARPPLAGSGPQEIHRRYPMLKDTGHDEKVIELQGQLQPCVVMMVLFKAQTSMVTKAAYVYTCPTTESQTTRRDEMAPAAENRLAMIR